MTDNRTRQKSIILKLCLFATGLAGIVAEFVLSTLASYLVGDSILQWSLIISLMLFSMGLGSFFTRFMVDNLFDKFIYTEYTLSIVCSISAGLSYFLAGYFPHIDLLIYVLAMLIGILIGLEIPLVTRINEAYEELRVNISAVMQYDYLGSLAGGLLFSFVALPKLGLTYTPIALGAINFFIALLLYWRFRDLTRRKLLIGILGGIITIFIVGLLYVIEPIMLFSEQNQYKDKIIFQEQSPYQKIIVTQWKDFHWLFINQNVQFSSYDEWLYHEPLVHPAMALSPHPANILVLGGGDGLAVREILKYYSVKKITLVDLDPAMTKLGRFHHVFLKLNGGSLNDPRVTIYNQDAYRFLKHNSTLYDVIIIDLPDPNNAELAKLYSRSFYATVKSHLAKYGVCVTQAADVSHATKTFDCILKTMQAAEMTTLPYHNFVQTMGNWGWILGVRAESYTDEELKQKITELKFEKVKTRFINPDAMQSMMNFGKGFIDDLNEIEVNTEIRPILHQYYLQAYELTR